MSQYGWTLWASIMDGSSTLDFDFWEWGMQKYERAVATFDGPELESMLDARRPRRRHLTAAARRPRPSSASPRPLERSRYACGSATRC
jgi:hypothetical protein